MRPSEIIFYMQRYGSYQTEEVVLSYIVDLDMTVLLLYEHEVYDMEILQNLNIGTQ